MPQGQKGNAKTQANAATQPTRQQEQLFVVKTNKNVFEAMDSLAIGKLQLNLVNHEVNPTVFVSHFVNMDVAEVLALDILNGSFTEHSEYKGSEKSKREDGKPEARVLKVTKRAPSKPGEKVNYPFAISIEVGEGQVIGQGAVKMVKKEQSVLMNLSELDMKRFAITILDRIRNFKLIEQLKAAGLVVEASKTA